MDRIAPEGGYLFEEKERYRQRIWGHFQSFCSDARWQSGAVLMPSSEGREIEVALGRGFREQNLHLVDYNPAIVATHKRKYKEAQAYGVDVGRAFERIKPRSIDVANLDLTGCISTKLGTTLAKISQAQAWSDDALIAVTVLRGRENTELLDWGLIFKTSGLFEYNHRLKPTDLSRVGFLYLACSGMVDAPGIWGSDSAPEQYITRRHTLFLSLVDADYYTSSNGQSMLWVVFRRKNQGAVKGKQTRKEMVRSLRAGETFILMSAAMIIKGWMNGDIDGNWSGELLRHTLRMDEPDTVRLLKASGLFDYLSELGVVPVKEMKSPVHSRRRKRYSSRFIRGLWYS